MSNLEKGSTLQMTNYSIFHQVNSSKRQQFSDKKHSKGHGPFVYTLNPEV